MRTLLLTDSDSLEQEVRDLAESLLRSARQGPLRVSVAEEQERVSPAEAGARLGFSRQHVTRLIQAGEMQAEQMPGSSYWQIPVAELERFEERREAARRHADEFSRSLDEAGAPLE